MQGRIAMLCLGALLMATSARAQESQTPAAAETQAAPAQPRLNALQGVGDIDARAMLNADILLAFVNLGLGADMGVLQLGPGVLAIGGELEAGACVTPCLALNLATGWTFSHMYYSPHARATYHFLPSSSPGMEKVDLYGLALAGLTVATTRVSGTASGTDFEYVGSDVGPSVGLGIGGKYFFQENFFFGAEGRLRYSAGEYTYTARAGNVTLSDTQSAWSLSGFNLQLFAGLRL